MGLHLLHPLQIAWCNITTWECLVPSFYVLAHSLLRESDRDALSNCWPRLAIRDTRYTNSIIIVVAWLIRIKSSYKSNIFKEMRQDWPRWWWLIIYVIQNRNIPQLHTTCYEKRNLIRPRMRYISLVVVSRCNELVIVKHIELGNEYYQTTSGPWKVWLHGQNQLSR